MGKRPEPNIDYSNAGVSRDTRMPSPEPGTDVGRALLNATGIDAALLAIGAAAASHTHTPASIAVTFTRPGVLSGFGTLQQVLDYLNENLPA